MIQVSVSMKGLRADTVRKLMEGSIGKKCPEALITVTRQEPPESRADRFAEAVSLAADARAIGEELRDELQDWRSNLPENLQAGEKAGELDDAISNPEDFISNCEEAEGASIDFPSMF